MREPMAERDELDMVEAVDFDGDIADFEEDIADFDGDGADLVEDDIDLLARDVFADPDDLSPEEAAIHLQR